MDIIYDYIENMFKTLPKNSEIENLKKEITANMEEKYKELKDEGKSENEAIGTVISEFGNIDEIIKEFGIEEVNDKEKYSEEKEEFKELTLKEINEFYDNNKRSSFMISIGVVLCLLGVSVMIFLTEKINTNGLLSGASRNVRDMLPLSVLLIFVVPAVALFIFGGIMMGKYRYIQRGEFNISKSNKIMIENEIEKNKYKRIVGITIGVCMCVLSPIAIFIGGMLNDRSGETYGVSVLLLIVAIAVFLFINFGSSDDAYKNVLKEGEYAPKNLKESKVDEAIGEIVWPITVCIFLIWGFIFGGWGIAWIVFPITGILFGAFRSIYRLIKKIN